MITVLQTARIDIAINYNYILVIAQVRSLIKVFQVNRGAFQLNAQQNMFKKHEPRYTVVDKVDSNQHYPTEL